MNRGKGKARPLGGGKAQPTPLPPPQGADVNEKGLYGSWLRAPPWGPERGSGRHWTSGAQVGRRCTRPPYTATAGWSKCCLLQVPVASTASTPNTTTFPEHTLTTPKNGPKALGVGGRCGRVHQVGPERPPQQMLPHTFACSPSRCYLLIAELVIGWVGTGVQRVTEVRNPPSKRQVVDGGVCA